MERLAYSRTQATEALAISRIETIEMPWGTRLIPVDELERLVAEWRRPARKRAEATTRGRPPLVAPELIRWIHAERAAGKSLRQIADGLNASGTPTAHGGRQWWPSTIRAVLQQ